MSTAFANLLTAFEVHSVERIREILDAGFDVRSSINGKKPVNYLIEMYFRSDKFPDCLRLLLERGAQLDDPKIESVLLNEPGSLEVLVRNDKEFLRHRTSLVSAFTPLEGATLLHVAAEYGNLAVAEKLLALVGSADWDAISSIWHQDARRWADINAGVNNMFDLTKSLCRIVRPDLMEGEDES